MNVLFLTMSDLTDIKVGGIYTDLMRKFVSDGHSVYVVSPSERRMGKPSHIIDGDGYKILKVRTLNLQKTNVVEKGVGQLLLESQYNAAIKRWFKDVKFDLVLYSTPPITFNKVISGFRKKGIRTYLMLKDIFPQNAVDLGMMSKTGILYKMFRKKERELYRISDRIGCMSPANCEYVKRENPEVDPAKVELCPNSIELHPASPVNEADKSAVLEKYGIPTDKTLFIYGGNLGRPQGLGFLLKVIEENEKRNDSFITIVGNGTEYNRMERWFADYNPKNSKLFYRLPKEDYDILVRSHHVGLIFLDPRFTIPNYPSRLLSYLENSMPVLAATDTNCDTGKIAEENGYGFWTENGDLDGFMSLVDKLSGNKELIKEMGDKGRKFLEENYDVDIVYRTIMKSIE